MTFLLGIGIAHAGVLITASLFWVGMIPFVCSLRKQTVWTLLWAGVVGLSLGWWRGSLYMQKLAAYQSYYDQKISLTATAMQDAAYGKNSQLTFDANHIVIDATRQKLKGKLSLSGFGSNAIFAGDTVQATGKLRSSLGSYQGRMSYAQLVVIAHHNTIINDLRRRFSAGVESAVPEPLASFGMGLLVGQRNNLPPAVSQSLLMVGLTHIIAVSGYNLTILLRSADRLAGERSKRITTFLSLALISVFLLFAGASASIVRAAIVSVLSIAASYYGRQFRPLLLIFFAAAITAYANPWYVWSDSGWYLSFLAFFGVMIIAPTMRQRWPHKLHTSVVATVALESICAEMMALPFVLHAFGQMSFIGLPANILVAALVPLAMLVTMIAGLAGVLLPALVGWFAWPARIILTYMLDMVRLLSDIPYVFVQHLSLSWLQMTVCYAIVLCCTATMYFKTKPKNDRITDRSKQLNRGNNVRTQQMVNN